MKYIVLLAILTWPFLLKGQDLQLHYEMAHWTDPGHNSSNFPVIYFEYFKAMDSTSAFVKPGAFFLKAENDLVGDRDNIGKAFIQASQTARLGDSKIAVAVQYSGGLGVTDPAQYSYYINNCFSAGMAYPFQWKGAYLNAEVFYNFNMLNKPSNDVMLSFYWGKGFWNYKVEFDGDFELYTLNHNQGTPVTQSMTGKIVSFFGEPQVWFKIKGKLSLGSKELLYYHVITTQNLFEVYPTVALRIKF